MLRIEPLPIENYVQQQFGHQSVIKIIQNWRVEPEVLVNIIINHFRDMGIYYVGPKQEKLMQKSLIHGLKNSPEIIKMLKRAEQSELSRRRNRHGD
jgi:hypothetical protein